MDFLSSDDLALIRSNVLTPEKLPVPLREIVEATVREAEWAATAVCDFLDRDRCADQDSDASNGQKTMSLDDALKFGTAARLRHLRNCGLADYLTPGFPMLEGILAGSNDENQKPSESVRGFDLTLQFLIARLSRMSWTSLANTHADLAMGEDNESNLMEEMARFIWNLRELGR